MLTSGSATERLVEFAVKTSAGDLPPEVRAWAARAILDTLGVAIAGRHAAGVVEARAQAQAWGGTPEATLWGSRVRVPAPQAALVNAVAARALDFDDVFDAIPLHPSAYLVPTAFAAAERAGGASGAELVAAVAVGAEVMVRLALGRGPTDPDAARPPLSRIMGPTVAAARLLGLDAARMRHALGLAFTSSAGELQSYDDGALAIRLQQGLVAEAAVKAVVYAGAGITGPWNFLEGRRSLARVDGIADLTAVIAGLGETFQASGAELKPWACCRCSHPAISAALRLRSDHALTAEVVDAIRVEVAPMCAAVVAEPAAVRFAPRTVVEAQFSLPYVVAHALAAGEVGLAAFAPVRLHDPVVRRLMERLEVKVRGAAAAGEGMIAPARVEVRLVTGRRVAADGSAATCRTELTVGGAERKFADCMAAGGRAAGVNGALALIANIADEPDPLGDLLESMAGGREEEG